MRNTAPAAKLAGAAAATCISRFTNAAARRLLTSARTACGCEQILRSCSQVANEVFDMTKNSLACLGHNASDGMY